MRIYTTTSLAVDQNSSSALCSFKNNPRAKNRVVCGEASLDKVLDMKAASPSDRDRAKQACQGKVARSSYREGITRLFFMVHRPQQCQVACYPTGRHCKDAVVVVQRDAHHGIFHLQWRKNHLKFPCQKAETSEDRASWEYGYTNCYEWEKHS